VGFERFGQERPLATTEEVAATETAIGRILPAPLRDMLLTLRNGDRVRANQLTTHPQVGVDQFLRAGHDGRDTIVKRCEELGDELPPGECPSPTATAETSSAWTATAASSSGTTKNRTLTTQSPSLHPLYPTSRKTCDPSSSRQRTSPRPQSGYTRTSRRHSESSRKSPERYGWRPPLTPSTVRPTSLVSASGQRLPAVIRSCRVENRTSNHAATCER
jgi:hypothetical protein